MIGSFGFGVAGRSSKASVFDPATLALTGWWRASYAGSPWTPTASAGSSGSNGNLTEATNPPATGAAVNGYTPADGDGTNDQLTAANLMTAYLANAAGTAIALIWADTAAADAGAATYYGNPGLWSDTGRIQMGFSDSGVRVGYYDGVDHNSTAKACGTGAWHMVWGRYNSTTLSVGVDGSAGAATLARGAAALAAFNAMAFRNYDASAIFDGKILEIMTSDTALTDGNIDNIKSYFNSRYALSL